MTCAAWVQPDSTSRKVRSPREFADAPIARIVLYTTMEIIHHGAEICLLRDLYPRKGDRSHV